MQELITYPREFPDALPFDLQWPLSRAPSLELPPPEVWLIDPSMGRLPTPTDDRGLIDIPRLIEVVKATVDPAYQWSAKVGVHHFYWPESAFLYSNSNRLAANPATFRELPINKGLIPRSFENWLHIVTEQPRVPDAETMFYFTEAWLVAKQLFASVQRAIQWERKARRRVAYLQQNPEILPEDFQGEDVIGNEVILETLFRHFRGVDRQLERLERVPREFRLVEPNEFTTEPGKFSPRHVTLLGKMVVPRSRKLVSAIAA